MLLLGAAVILGLTYLSACLLLHELKDPKIEEATITTPFLTIKARLGDSEDAANAGLKGAITQPDTLSQDDMGPIKSATWKRRSVSELTHKKCPVRMPEHKLDAGSLQSFRADPQNPYHSSLDMHVLRLFCSLIILWAGAFKMILSVPNF
jgi:hypothetical protein